MITVKDEELAALANSMANLLDDLTNTLANYRNLQGMAQDFVGCSVTTSQITEIRTLLDKANYINKGE